MTQAIAILQARMGSSRLPGKTLMPLGGKPVLTRVVERLRQVNFLSQIIVATTTSDRDNAICAAAEEMGLSVFRGSENNVLDRYYRCAQEYGASQIVRATADDPLTSPKLLEQMWQEHLAGGYDYTTTSGFPVGVQEEIVTFEALERCHKHSTLPNHFEHVLEYIQENPDRFSIGTVKAPQHLSRPEVRVTLDTENDYLFLTKLFDRFGEESTAFEIKELIAFWDTVRNEAA